VTTVGTSKSTKRREQLSWRSLRRKTSFSERARSNQLLFQNSKKQRKLRKLSSVGDAPARNQDAIRTIANASREE